MARTATVTRTDERDSRQKQAFARFTAANNPEVAEKMANAIANDTSLLVGLAHMVMLLCKHDKSRRIMGNVFAQPGVARKFPHAYKAYAEAELFG
jgi:hypothetical protein